MTTLLASPATQAFIDGQFVDASSQATIDTYAPATGELLARVADCEAADVERAVTSARGAFEDGVWRNLGPAERKGVLLRFADLVERHASELARLDSVDAGKPITDCEELDLPDVVNTLRWYAEVLDKVFDKVSPTGRENLALDHQGADRCSRRNPPLELSHRHPVMEARTSAGSWQLSRGQAARAGAAEHDQGRSTRVRGRPARWCLQRRPWSR